MDNNYYKNMLKKINQIAIYKNILNDEIINILKDLSSLDNIDLSFSLLVSKLIENAEENGFRGNLLKNYIIKLFLTDENIFTMYCENNINVEQSSLYKLVLKDIEIMKDLIEFDLKTLNVNDEKIDEIFNYEPINKNININYSILEKDDSPQKIIEKFINYYNKYGCGTISIYKTFKYDSSKCNLRGIKYHDPTTFDDIIGYKTQIKTLIENTKAFLAGYQANNVLLVGSRGTGKSSCVKALANKYFNYGLRLIEITKEQIIELPKILSLIKSRGRRFIIFIDDLSFDEYEIQYKYMKSLLEGGSESKPENVLFYATSNRRHLIQEKWSDRSAGSEEAEIHTTDTLNEKLSLSDRFGITITFPKPNPKEYIEIVHGLAKKQNLQMEKEKLEKLAMQWELSQKGMSGRTAKQFINNMLWKVKNNNEENI